MSKLIQGATFSRMSDMDEAARKEALDVVTRLAAAYYAGRDSANYATNVREEARDQLLAADSLHGATEAMCRRNLATVRHVTAACGGLDLMAVLPMLSDMARQRGISD